MQWNGRYDADLSTGGRRILRCLCLSALPRTAVVLERYPFRIPGSGFHGGVIAVLQLLSVEKYLDQASLYLIHVVRETEDGGGKVALIMTNLLWQRARLLFLSWVSSAIGRAFEGQHLNTPPISPVPGTQATASRP